MIRFIIRTIKNTVKRKRKGGVVDFDEIFLDSKNLPEFDTQQFEGQIEHPIARQSLIAVCVIFVLLVGLFGTRLWFLQVTEGATYLKQSQNNSLSREPIFAPRGNIYDRNGVPLAWNGDVTEAEPWGQRTYIGDRGFSHILGYVSYPAKDKSGYYWKTDIVGKDGAEKRFNDLLAGVNGSKIIEKDIAGVVQQGSIVNQPEPGKNVSLTIDSRLQAKMQEILAGYVRTADFNSGSAVMMEVRTGEVIVMTSVPEYDSNVMSSGDDVKKIREYLSSSRTPLLNRAVSGLFTPGSIVKPYIALEALKQAVITPTKLICSCGYITVPNPYDPEHPGIFRDYNPNNSLVDMRKAISISSNIYFFEVGGGYQGQKGIGIDGIGTALTRFGLTKPTGIDLFGEQTGFVPSPDWKAQRFNGEIWRIGDTYNTAIGQYGVQVTPLEMVRAVAGIARKGTLVTPHIQKDTPTVEEEVTDIPEESYKIVQEGMKMGATEGTGRILLGLPFESASKTGTAQVGPGGRYVNAWMNMFYPYEDPHYALVVVLERGPQTGLGASQRVAREFFDWMVINTPEYLQ